MSIKRKELQNEKLLLQDPQAKIVKNTHESEGNMSDRRKRMSLSSPREHRMSVNSLRGDNQQQ